MNDKNSSSGWSAIWYDPDISNSHITTNVPVLETQNGVFWYDVTTGVISQQPPLQKPQVINEDNFMGYLNKILGKKSNFLGLRIIPSLCDHTTDKEGKLASVKLIFEASTSDFFTVYVNNPLLIVTPSRVERTLLHGLSRTPFNGNFLVSTKDFTIEIPQNMSHTLLEKIIIKLMCTNRCNYEWVAPLQDMYLARETKAPNNLKRVKKSSSVVVDLSQSEGAKTPFNGLSDFAKDYLKAQQKKVPLPPPEMISKSLNPKYQGVAVVTGTPPNIGKPQTHSGSKFARKTPVINPLKSE